MIKLLIVDDEKATREGLRENISWTEIGVDVVGEAEDGVKALALSMQIQPDILLCDVRMPKMNGIELATQLKAQLPDCKIIFLSGHLDKEYLKSAIQLRAVNYVEKPVDLDEITEVIRNTVSICLEEKEKKQIEIEMKVRLEESNELLSHQLALDLLTKKIPIGEVQVKLHNTKLDFPVNGHYITIIIKLNLTLNYTQEMQQSYNDLILKMIEDKFNIRTPNFIAGYKDNEHIIHMNDITETKQSIRTLLEDVKTGIDDILQSNSNVFIGVGKRIQGIDNILISYQAAWIALHKQFLLGYNHIVFFDEKPENAFSFNEESVDEFIAYMKDEKKDDAIAFITKISNDIRQHENTQINYIKNIFFILILKLSTFAEERNMPISDHSNDNQFFWDILSRSNTLNEIERYIIDKIEYIFQHMEERDNKSNTVFKIIKYIQDHHHDHRLSIKRIADHAFLTPTYVCLIFKNGTGKTINQCIIEVRIEQSKEHLKNRRIKLQEVAQRVGYIDANYYAKTFKKIVGMNPSEFREKFLL